MPTKEQVRASLNGNAEAAISLSHRIHAHPELGFEEYRAAAWIGDLLFDAGFTVETGVAGLDTALVASAGDGELVVGICAEYDALPGIGHACGHNVIAGSAVATAMALAPYAADLGLTLKLFGTPAEENGGGKILMLDAGVFAGTHAAMMVHPAAHDGVQSHVLANGDLLAEFHGRAAHASMSPHDGINAGDAATISQVAVGLLRQQLVPGDQIHGIVVNGGEAPNIIPSETSAHYYVRSRTLEGLEVLKGRVLRCIQAGAVATGCDAKITHTAPDYADFRDDDVLTSLFTGNFMALGRSASSEHNFGLGSTDMANVSRAIPAIHPMVGINSGSSTNHQPEFAAHCTSPDADRALLDGACAMAWTVLDLAQTTARQYLLGRL